jgi:hypothetical protein
MKFLGIETKVIGEDSSSYFVLKTLQNLENNTKIYTNPAYLNKFYIIANVFSQNLYCDLINNKEVNKDEVFFTIHNLNESMNASHIYEQLQTNYESFIEKSDTIDECLEKIDDFEMSRQNLSTKKLNSGIYTYSYYEDYEATFSDCTSDDYPSEDDLIDSDSEEDTVESISEPEIKKESYIKKNTETKPKKKTEQEILDSITHKDTQFGKMETMIELIDNCVKTKKYVKLSLFKRDSQFSEDDKSIIYDTDHLYFLNSFFVGIHVPIRRTYHHRNVLSNKNEEKFIKNLPTDIKNKTKIFKDCYELNDIYMKKIQFDFELICKCMTNQTGIYLNPTDILFTFILNKEISANVSNEELACMLTYDYFKKTNFKEVYKHNYNKVDILDRVYFSIDSGIVCDICESMVSIKTNSYFYSNPELGDICRQCFSFKKEEFENRIKYIKKIIILEGKRSLFKKAVIKMREKLKTLKIKRISKKKRDEITSRVLKETTKSYNPPTCKVCYGELNLEECKDVIKKGEAEENIGNTNISISTTCGHIFHTGCISEMIISGDCPYCRRDTTFTRIFL